MTLSSEFSGLRVIEGNILPVTWKIKADLDTSAATSEHDGMITYHKMVFWLSEILDTIAIISADDAFLEYFYTAVNNPLMVLPRKPTDDVLCGILADKIAAIAGEASIKLLGVSLSGSDHNITYNCIYSEEQESGDLEYLKPCIEYARKDVSIAWWKRPSGDFNDFLTDEDLEHGADTAITHRYDVLKEFAEQVAKTLTSNAEEVHFEFSSEDADTEDSDIEDSVLEVDWTKKND